MCRFFVILLCLMNALWAESLHVKDNFKKASTFAYQTTLKDYDGNLDVQRVLDYQGASNYTKPDASYNQGVFWTKLALQNDGETPISLIFQNFRASMNYVDVWIYKGGDLVATHELGIFRDPAMRKVRAIKSVFYASLQPQEEMIVVFRMESLGPINLAWEVMETNLYTFYNSAEMVLWGLFGGLMFALIMYNLAMYISLAERAFLYYILHVACAWWYVYATNGILYFWGVFNPYFVFISSWFVPFFMVFWIALFCMTYFELHNKDFFGNRLFKWIAWVSLGLFVLMVADAFMLILIPYSKYFMFIGLFIIVVLFVLVTRLAVKKYDGAIYFVVGEGAYLVALFITGSALSTMLELTAVLRFVLPTGLLIEAVMLSFALSKKMGRIKAENQKNQLLFMEESKFATVGKNAAQVIHQWKEPIASLSSHITYWEGLLKFGKKEQIDQALQESIPTIKATLGYLNDSLRELYLFFKGDQVASEINLASQIALALKIQRDRLVLAKIEVNVQCDEAMRISGSPSALANVLMILLDNSIEAFEELGTKGKISIKVNCEDKKCVLCYKDNAGGIELKPIESIFEPQVTTKKEGMGLGLALAMKLVKERLNGSLHVRNIDGGAEFTLKLCSSRLS